jgi:hypothetical protein
MGTCLIVPPGSKRVKFFNREVAMKDSQKLQKKLREVLRNKPNIRVSLPAIWTEEQFKEVAWIIQDYVNQSGDVTNDDPLQEWLEEYHFFLAQSKQ